ncbi:MAG: nucleotidyltransferase domain-containing protein [Neisseria sicca]|uniref:Putative nucleotidyltransferase n=1 Tax=Neisseria sicca VK64 TaxID=1095748 RepID=I2ND23_NEISI|nr:nucleotidyltransferase domain-containing protein [Neisseria sicca]EIG23734.1 putative nucleotidyltransferase [Neisseria sicca VK64]MBF1291454.1 nucleotidyltransferase domain-containing protein [Neisseria sicca]
MKQAIQEKLTHIARTEPLHFLLAVESGSRAWGFASPDSDYDVRAIYIRPQPYYLQIDEAKDTFEFIENQWFDVGGWDIRKALRLLRKSNAVLLEWLRSPMVYTQDDDFTGRLNALAPQYVQAAALLHHYRGIAGNALKAMDLVHPVKLKKWFYVLRPLLAARWAVKQGGIPPMTLAELMSEWQTDCAAQITDLVAIKAEQDESYLHTLSPELQRLTVDLYNEVSELSAPATQAADSAPLNELFRETLAAVYP